MGRGARGRRRRRRAAPARRHRASAARPRAGPTHGGGGRAPPPAGHPVGAAPGGPGPPHARHHADRSRLLARRRGRGLRHGADDRPLPPRPPPARPRDAPRQGLPAGLRRLRRARLPLLRNARRGAHHSARALLHAAAQPGQVALRRARADGGAAEVVVDGDDALVRPPADRRRQAALPDPAAPRLRALDEAARALLPLRLGDARALLRGRADLPALPGGAALGGR